MNYPVPHYKKNKTVRDSTLEDLCYVDLHHIICRPPFQYKLESNFEDDFEMQGAAYTAFPSCPPKAVLPFPLFLPVPVCCGRGPVANKIYCPHEYPSSLLDLKIKFECRRIASYIRGCSKSSMINKLKRNKKIPPILQGLQDILCRYSSLEKYSSSDLSFAGGNLSSLTFESTKLLVHTTAEDDGTLCLTPWDEGTGTNYPTERAIQLRLEDGGLVFQICAARESPFGLSEPNSLFVTRQLETSTLWSVCRENDGELMIKKLQHLTDDTSMVRCVDVSSFMRTEWCELRNQTLTVSRHSERTYRRNLEGLDYRQCQWANHPQTLLLSSDKSMELVDMRLPTSSKPSTLLSLNSDRFLTSYNILSSENIRCIAPTSESTGYLLATEKNVIIADLRMNSRLLYKAAHLMNKPPQFVNFVLAPAPDNQDISAQWTLLTSASGSSAMVVHRWDNAQMTSTSVRDVSFRTPSPLVEPVKRPDLADTLDKLQHARYSLDWSAENRLTQPITGQICDYVPQERGAGVLRVLMSTAPGDVYFQRINPVGQNVAEMEPADWPWLWPWMNSVREIEQKFNTLKATEIFDADQVLLRLLKRKKETKGDWADDCEEEEEEESQEEQEPDFQVPDCVRFPFKDQDKFPMDRRGTDYFKAFCEQAPQGSQRSPSPKTADVELEDSLDRDFGENLISSTPFQKSVAPGGNDQTTNICPSDWPTDTSENFWGLDV